MFVSITHTGRGRRLPSVVVLYQFFPPDNIVSSVLFGELSTELVNHGWDVTAFPCNRDSRNQALRYVARPNWNGVHVLRLWRPNMPQSTSLGRLLNSIWMIARWSLLALNPRIRPDALIVGTDPVLGVLVAIAWRLLKPRTKIAHWCFDLYPEAAIADGILKPGGKITKALRALATKAYAACDLIVDIGPCMRALLKRYRMDTPMETRVPWALKETIHASPIDYSERLSIFKSTRLALMYSGSLGRAHTYEGILQLARRVRTHEITFAFSVSESNARAVRESILSDDDNVVFVPSVEPGEITKRLSSADIHIVTLKEDWEGIVVPSKFFGALSMGRPVLFCGSQNSAIARWINEYRVGWVLVPDTADWVVEELKRLTVSHGELDEMFSHCHDIYSRNFSKALTTAHWDRDLRSLLSPIVCLDRVQEENANRL
jgi:colanic acid biosynthesis glycosyl transferase WcaI